MLQRTPTPFRIESEPIDGQLVWALEGDNNRSNHSPNGEYETFSYTGIVLGRWEHLVEKICSEDCWDRLNRRKKKLPVQIREVFETVENSGQISFNQEERIRLYKEFSKASSCFRTISSVDTLNSTEIENLLRINLGIDIDENDLRDLISIRSTQSHHEFQGGRFDFFLFVSLISDVLKFKQENVKAPDFGFNLKVSQLPIDPDSEGKQLWDFLISLLLLYCSFAVPYSIAFETDDEPEALQVVGIIIDSLFLFDMLLSFVTAYDEKGLFVRDQRQISIHYLKTWFFPDLAGSFPFDRVISLAAQSQAGMRATNLFRALRFIRMLKLTRALKLISKLNRLRQKEGFEHLSNLIGILTATFLLLFVAHTMGCIFTLLIGDESSQNWLLHYRPELIDADTWVRYVAALYWAIITINTTGYGDVVPVTPSERLFTIIVALVGAVVFSYCVGTISLLVSQYSTAETRFQAKLRSVFEYFQFREISANLKRKLRSHYCLSYRSSPVLYEESEILNELSEPLQAEVLSAIGKNVVSSLPILQGCGDNCVGLIASRLKVSNFVPGQTIYSQGDRGSVMYMIVKGRVILESLPQTHKSLRRLSLDTNVANICVVNGRRENKTAISKGEVFGEPGLFPHLLSGLRAESAVAETWTRVYSLSAHTIRDIQGVYPEVYQRFKDLCELKALESKIAAELPSSTDHKWRECEEPGCLTKLDLASSRMQLHLLDLVESVLLKPAGGTSSNVMHLFLLSSNTNDLRERCWHNISCILSEKGEFLYIYHQREDFDLSSPRSLGFLLPHRSVARRLLPGDLGKFGLSTKDPLGFDISLFLEVGSSSSEGDPYQVKQVVVCASSKNEFAALHDNLSDWCEVEDRPAPEHFNNCHQNTKIACDDQGQSSSFQTGGSQNAQILFSSAADLPANLVNMDSWTHDLHVWRQTLHILHKERSWLQLEISRFDALCLKNCPISGEIYNDSFNPDFNSILCSKSTQKLCNSKLQLENTAWNHSVMDSLDEIPKHELNLQYARIYSSMKTINGFQCRLSSAVKHLDLRQLPQF